MHDKQTADRFWAKVDRTGGCWLWTGAVVRRYGQIAVGHRRMRANRVAWELTFGGIPEGLVVCHRCDVPLCVRPDHLFLGTVGDNTRDAAAKGRMTRGTEFWSAKLDESRVRAIRALSPIANKAAVARHFGISRHQVADIETRRSWAWLP